MTIFNHSLDIPATPEQVFAAISEDCAGAEVLKKLVARGLTVQYTASHPGRLGRVCSRFINPFRKLTAFAPDLIVVSSGSAYDPIYQSGLAEFLHTTSSPFIFICHFNAETFWVDDAMRTIMGRIYAKAATSVFVSQENLRLTERQLALKIPVTKVIPPPLRLDLKDPLPWPEPTSDSPWRSWNETCAATTVLRWLR